MTKIILLAGLSLLGAGAWFVGSTLSSDAVGLALGVIFGVLASLPGAILVLATNRRHERDCWQDYGHPQPRYSPPPALPAGYVVVLPDGRRALLLEDGREGE